MPPGISSGAHLRVLPHTGSSLVMTVVRHCRTVIGGVRQLPPVQVQVPRTAVVAWRVTAAGAGRCLIRVVTGCTGSVG